MLFYGVVVLEIVSHVYLRRSCPQPIDHVLSPGAVIQVQQYAS